MAETYEKKLARRTRTRMTFPEDLQKCPLRHVDRVNTLTDAQKGLLGKAMKSGLLSIPLAIDRMEDKGDNITIEWILKDNQTKTENTNLQREDIETLVDILNDCFPSPPTTLQALAESSTLSEVVRLLAAFRQGLESPNAASDFVIVSLYAASKFGLNAIEAHIKKNPAFLQTIRSSGLSWSVDNQ